MQTMALSEAIRNRGQRGGAVRIEQTAFFHLGNPIECGDTEEIFTNPRDERTQGYITGRFG